MFRTVYKDIGGSDPERTAPPAVADYVTEIFKSTCIKVKMKFMNSVAHCQMPLRLMSSLMKLFWSKSIHYLLLSTVLRKVSLFLMKPKISSWSILVYSTL